jgi:hypothetical protein
MTSPLRQHFSACACATHLRDHVLLPILFGALAPRSVFFFARGTCFFRIAAASAPAASEFGWNSDDQQERLSVLVELFVLDCSRFSCLQFV